MHYPILAKQPLGAIERQTLPNDVLLLLARSYSDVPTIMKLRSLAKTTGIAKYFTVEMVVRLDCNRFWSKRGGWEFSLKRAHFEWALENGDGLPLSNFAPLWMEMRRDLSIPRPPYLRIPVPKKYLTAQIEYLVQKGARPRHLAMMAPILYGQSFLDKFHQYLDLAGRSDALWTAAARGRHLDDVEFILQRLPGAPVHPVLEGALTSLAFDNDDARLLEILLKHKEFPSQRSQCRLMIEEMMLHCIRNQRVLCADIVLAQWRKLIVKGILG